jgi:hypothetical protein
VRACDREKISFHAILSGRHAAYDDRLSIGHFSHYVGGAVGFKSDEDFRLPRGGGCHSDGRMRRKETRVAGRSPHLPGSSETGIASWYGVPYHGRQAANGEIYDMEKMTAAHRTLPFGTWVQVRNLANDKTVSVRITDRGPFVGGRILDLSRGRCRSHRDDWTGDCDGPDHGDRSTRD